MKPTKDTNVTTDYIFRPLDDTECPVCGIKSFEHLHRTGTKPNDFIRINGTKDTPKETWEEQLLQIYKRIYAQAKADMIEKIDASIPRYLKGGELRNQYFVKGYNECKNDMLATLREDYQLKEEK